MRGSTLFLILQIFNFYCSGQSIYVRPLLSNKLDNYSANPQFTDNQFTENDITYKITSPKYKFNSAINPGILIGYKANLFFFETGICRERITCDSKVEILTGQKYKAYRYTSGLNISRIPLQVGFMCHSFKGRKTKSQLNHQVWISMGIAFTHMFKKPLIYTREDRFTLNGDEFIINNAYGFATFGYFANFTLGLEYQLNTLKKRNLFSVNISYSLARHSTGLMSNYIDISHNSSAGKKTYYLVENSNTSGIQLTISKLLYVYRRNSKHLEDIQLQN